MGMNYCNYTCNINKHTHKRTNAHTRMHVCKYVICVDSYRSTNGFISSSACRHEASDECFWFKFFHHQLFLASRQHPGASPARQTENGQEPPHPGWFVRLGGWRHRHQICSIPRSSRQLDKGESRRTREEVCCWISTWFGPPTVPSCCGTCKQSSNADTEAEGRYSQSCTQQRS